MPMSSTSEKNDSPEPENRDKGPFPTLSRIDSVQELGTQIGPYKLLSVLGEGGLGMVYRAEQKEPVRRQVALKVIKPGMDSKQVIARFEAERQALALLDHPNVAHVYDVGTTDFGRPYFAMECVKGVPIDVIATKTTELLGPDLILIQAKKYTGKNTVKIEEVKALWADLDEAEATKALIATTTRLEKGARTYCEARKYRIGYAELATVREWLSQLSNNPEKS